MFIEARLVIAQMSIHRQMDKPSVLCPHNEISFGHTRAWRTDPGHSTEEP